MNKCVITSVSPEECNSILCGLQTMLVRKNRPKIETPFKSYIYMTATKERCRLWEYMTAYINNKGEMLNGSQKVIGSFVCDEIIEDERGENADVFSKYALLSLDEQKKYGANKPLYGWHISDLKIYDKPKELAVFRPWCEKSRKTDDNLEMCCNCKNAFFDEDGAFFDCGLTSPPRPYIYCESILEK